MNHLQRLQLADPLLTSVIRGYSNNEFIGNSLFPIVETETENGKIPLFGKSAFKTYESGRALRAGSNEIPIEWLTLQDFTLQENDLVTRIDVRELQEAHNVLNLEKHCIETTVNSLNLGLEEKQAILAQNPNTYSLNNQIDMSNEAKHFDDNTFDFVKFILLKMQYMETQILKKPNTIVIGGKVWDYLKMHPILLKYLKGNNDNSDLFGIATTEAFKNLLGFENVLIGKSYKSVNDNEFTPIWGNNIVLSYVSAPNGKSETVYKPSFGYTLKLKGYPFADTYYSVDLKNKNYRATDLYSVHIVANESGYLIKNPINPENYN